MTNNTETSKKAESSTNSSQDHVSQDGHQTLRETRDNHVRIDNIRKTFNKGSVVACDDVNINIGESEFVVLVGPSGCGKTTTLRCVAGLDQPDRGRITVNGDDVTNAKPKDRNLAFVFQSIALFPHMTVRRNIRFGLDMNTALSDEAKNQRVNEVAEILGLDGMLDRQPKALSGGQQQRVSLGRAMVMEPDAFLLDEPFSALDANLRDEMRIEVKRIQRELNKPMVFVTHDQEEAMTLGDRIVVMNEGLVQQIGTPHEIYNEPQNLFVADFIGSPSPNFLDCTVVKDEGSMYLENSILKVGVTDEQESALQQTETDTVTLGIRPEYLELDRSDAATLTAEVDVVEPLGDRDAVYLSTAEQSFSSITTQGHISRDMHTVAVEFDIQKAWLFKPNGTRIA